MSDYHSPAEGSDEGTAPDDDLAAAAAREADRRRRRRLAAAAADGRVLAEAVAEGRISEAKALEVLAADHGGEPQALEVGKAVLADSEPPMTPAAGSPQLGAADVAGLEAEREEARLAEARAETRLEAERRRQQALEAKLEELRREEDFQGGAGPG